MCVTFNTFIFWFKVKLLLDMSFDKNFSIDETIRRIEFIALRLKTKNYTVIAGFFN